MFCMTNLYFRTYPLVDEHRKLYEPFLNIRYEREKMGMNGEKIEMNGNPILSPERGDDKTSTLCRN